MSPVRPLNPVRNIYYPRNFGKISNGVNTIYVFVYTSVDLFMKGLISKSKFEGLTG